MAPSFPPSPPPVSAPIPPPDLSSHSTILSNVDFSPPLIAMVVVVAAAFLLVTYSRLISRRFLSPLLRRLRRWHHRRRRLRHLSIASSSSSDLRSLSPSFPFDSFHYSSLSPYGLDDSIIKTLPLFLFSAKSGADCRDCAVCLLEFEDGDYVRTLPSCSHAFHVDCIDAWLRSHANCPLCRAAILGHVAPPSPFVPLMASRIRPSLDDEADAVIFRSIVAGTTPSRDFTADHEILPSCTDDQSPPSRGRFELNRSYSFGFERGSASERIATVTESPWRYRRGAAFWGKRASPFGSIVSNKARVFSFRYYRGMKSPFFRRRSAAFFPLSERVPGGCSRRSKSVTSPIFFRLPYSSSRLRCGDPEALLSPERLNRR